MSFKGKKRRERVGYTREFVGCVFSTRDSFGGEKKDGGLVVGKAAEQIPRQ